MTYAIATAMTVLNAFWLLLVVLGLPGNWLIVATTVAVAWWRWDVDAGAGQPMFSQSVLIIIAALALAGEVFEVVAGSVGAKKAGGTHRGAVGALLGAIVGGILGTIFIPIPVLGTVIGTCGGAAIGAWGLELHSGREMGAALKSGAGAGIGRFAGTIGKVMIGALIWALVTVSAFWP